MQYYYLASEVVVLHYLIILEISLMLCLDSK